MKSLLLVLLLFLSAPASAGHTQKEPAPIDVVALCYMKEPALTAAPFVDDAIFLGIIQLTPSCGALRWPADGWVDQIVECTFTTHGRPICTIKVHDQNGNAAYTWIYGTREEVIRKVWTQEAGE